MSTTIAHFNGCFRQVQTLNRRTRGYDVGSRDRRAPHCAYRRTPGMSVRLLDVHRAGAGSTGIPAARAATRIVLAKSDRRTLHGRRKRALDTEGSQIRTPIRGTTYGATGRTSLPPQRALAIVVRGPACGMRGGCVARRL